MLIKQISIFIENKPGRLTDVLAFLSNANVNLRALSLADAKDYGILRLIVDDPEKAETVLHGEGLTVSITQVTAIKLSDEPGALVTVLRLLSDSGIEVEYAYAFLTHKEDAACVIIRVEDNQKAAAILREKGIDMMEEIAL